MPHNIGFGGFGGGGSSPFSSGGFGQSGPWRGGWQGGQFFIVDPTPPGQGTRADLILQGTRGQKVCDFLQTIGVTCDLEGIRQAVSSGLAVITDLQGDPKEGMPETNGDCSPETVWNEELQMCVFPGSPASGGGQAVIGGFGIPAMQPRVVGQRQSAHGTVPIRECGPGMILGKDNLCYAKGSIPRSFRKWPPAPKAPVTAADKKAIQQADRATKRVKKLATKVGFSCKKR